MAAHNDAEEISNRGGEKRLNIKAWKNSERRPLLAVDVIIRRSDGTIVLVKRKYSPFKDFYAIPGGFVEYGETVEAAAVREVREETGLNVSILKLVGIYSNPERDPRCHVISIAYLAEEVGGTLRPSTDAKEVHAFKKIPKELAFDHQKILEDALKLSREMNEHQ